MTQIQAEFSAPVSANLTDLYRGGAYVPNHANTSGIPTSGAIAFSDFYGASAEAPIDAEITDRTVTAASATTATAGYRIDSDGTAYTVVNGSSSAISGEWLVAGSNTDFEVRATLQSGVTPSGTLGSWLATTSARTWAVSSSGVLLTSVILVEIRTGSTVLASATITLQAERIGV